MPGTAVYQLGTVRAYLGNSKLGGASENAADWRMLWHTRAYAAIGAMQDETAVVSGEFATPGTVVLSPEQDCQGYRWLRAEFATGGTPVTCTIGNKQFTGVEDGGYVWFDLCGPANASASTDDMDTRWPIDTLASRTDTVSGSGVMWGCTELGTVVFTGSAGSVGSDGLVLVRREHSRLYMNPRRAPYTDWPQQIDGGAIRMRRFVDGDTDGRRSLELADGRYQAGAYTQQLIEDVPVDASTMASRGWSVSLTAGSVDGGEYSYEGTAWFTGKRPATYLHGGGMFYGTAAGGSLGWHANPLDASGSVDIYAQLLMDAIELTPHFGDGYFYADGAWGTPYSCGTAALGKIMRGVATGLVYTSAMDPKTGQIVTVRRASTSDDAGSGTSDDYGCYETGVPGGVGFLTHDVIANAVLPVMLYGADRRRACFEVAGAQWISYDVNAVGRHVRSYVSGSAIVVGYSNDPTGTFWTDVASGLDGAHPCVRWENRHANMRAVVDYDAGGSVYTTWTMNDGGGFAPVHTIAAGSYPTFCITPDGRHLHYWYDGGAIKGICLDAFGGTVLPTFTAVSSGVDEDAIDCKDYATAGNRWNINLLYRSGGSVTIKRSIDGVTFI